MVVFAFSNWIQLALKYFWDEGGRWWSKALKNPVTFLKNCKNQKIK